MRKLLLSLVLVPTVASAANTEHATCVAMVTDAYEGLAVLTAGDLKFTFEAKANERLDSDKRAAVSLTKDEAIAAAGRYIDALSEVCEALR